MKVRQKAKQLAKTMGLVMMSAMTVSSLCSIQAQADTVSYSDLNPNYWAYNAIMDLSNKGIAHGSDGAFNPEAYVTRAEFATFLVNSLHVPLSSATTSDFSDVPTNSWYFSYVKTAYQANIVHGVGTGQFAPNDPISREDMMVMLTNALHLQNIPSSLVNAMLPFTDATSIKSYAQSAIALGKELQLVSGNPQGDFQPLANTKRAEVAVVLDHMIGLPQDRLQAMQASTFQPTTHLAVTVQPNSNVVAGQQAQVQISLVDGNNQPATLTTPVSLTLAVSNAQIGTVNDQSLVIPAGGTATTTFLAETQPGNDVISAIPVTSSLATTLSGSTKVNVYTQNASKLVSGKGMWLMWSDWHNNNSDQLIAKAKANGMTHLYIEVATSWHGEDFYGNDALDDLLPKAHAAGLKVIGWVYTALANPTHDAQVDVQVAQYHTPSGDQVDGLTPDIEENVTQNNVATYSSILRNSLGPSYPLILCTYPPSWRPSYPWTTFGQYYDVIAPMDYWHDYAHAYTYNDAYSEISNTIQKIRQVTGKPNIPITVIGQGYDMFNDNGTNAPTAAEIRGSMDASKQNGAIGYSMFRWSTLNAAEWQAFGSYSW